MFIDVHAHLYDEKIEDIKKVVLKAKERGVEKIICCGSNLQDSALSVEIANEFEGVYACVGVHPEDVLSYNDEVAKELIKLCKNKKVVGFGEIGLDYYYDKSKKELQKQVFEKQLCLANSLKLPVVIHTREATGDMIEILSKNKSLLGNGGVIHCFNKNLTVAKIFIDLGFHLSIGGALTFPDSKKLKNAVKEIPLEKILLETDCPYMTPVPFRGQINEPKNVVIVAEEIARIKEIPVEEVEKITTENAKRLFNF